MQDFYQNSAIWSDGSTHHLKAHYILKQITTRFQILISMLVFSHRCDCDGDDCKK